LAEAAMPRFFRVSGHVLHQIVLALEHGGWISSQPGMSRSIQLLITLA
jgi:hypothetical protein